MASRRVVRIRRERQAFQSDWLRGKSCKRCGTPVKGGNAAVVHRGGLKTPSLWNCGAATKLRFLAECDVYCWSCIAVVRQQSRHGFPDSTPEQQRQQIENGLLEFRGVHEVAALVHASGPIVRVIAQKLRRAGNTCGCGRGLAHAGSCLFRRDMVRGESKESTPKPVALRDPSRCSAEKACPFPAVANGTCTQHAHFFEYGSELLGDKLQPWEFIPTANNPIPLLHLATRWELEHYQTTTYRQGGANA